MDKLLKFFIFYKKIKRDLAIYSKIDLNLNCFYKILTERCSTFFECDFTFLILCDKFDKNIVIKNLIYETKKI